MDNRGTDGDGANPEFCCWKTKQCYCKVIPKLERQEATIKFLKTSLSLAFDQLKAKDDEIRKLQAKNNQLQLELLQATRSGDGPDDGDDFKKETDETGSLTGNRKLLLEKVFPFIFPFMDKTDILNCRSVSKEYSFAIDDFLASHPSHFRPYEAEVVDPRMSSFLTIEELEWKSLGPYFLENRDVIQDEGRNGEKKRFNFSTFDYTHPRNPFIGRALTVSYLREGGPDAILHYFMDDTCVFLKTFGNHIWNLGLIPGNSLWPVEFLNYVQKFLKHCTNLKTLRLKGTLLSDKKRTDCQCSKLKITCKHGNYWTRYLSTHPIHLESLPPNLDSLCLDVENLQSKVQAAFVRQCGPQLRRLELRTWNLTYSTTVDLSKLSELHITKIESKEVLQSLQDLNCPNLKKLAVQIDFLDTAAENGSLELLLQLVNHFPKLVALRLGTSYYSLTDYTTGILERDSKIPIDLLAPARLHTLEIVSSPLTSYHILSRFPYLKYLHIMHQEVSKVRKAGFPEQAEEVVEIREYLGNCRKSFYDSNIWNMLPYLEVLTVVVKNYDRNFESTKTFSREDYDSIVAYENKIWELRLFLEELLINNNHFRGNIK